MSDIRWLEPIDLNFESALEHEDRFVRMLNHQLRTALKAADVEAGDIERAVYVIRMTGPFIVSYDNWPSPVLYIGRGRVGVRLSKHLRKWAYSVHKFGNDVGMQVRIVIPRRRARLEYYKCVEADLLFWFAEIYGQLPFMNSRREIMHCGQVDYGQAQEKRLRQLIGIGRGIRHKWAIMPLASNPLRAVYLKG